MREAEMRRRIDGFLKRRMQAMLAPALGLGLAVAGCGKTTSTPIYSAPNPDGQIGPIGDAAGLAHDTPVYSAPMAPDASTADVWGAKDTTVLGLEAAPDVASVADAATDFGKADLIPIDEAETPDANRDSPSEAGSSEAGSGVDAGMDLGISTVKYMAQAPDAGLDLA